MDAHLDGLYELTHAVLKRLKMGDKGAIQCNKDYDAEEVMNYVMAYAFHKRKWFESKHEKALDIVQVTRVPQPNWEKEEEFDAEEEL